MRKTICTLLCPLLSSAALAAAPPCTEAPYRAFDFWIGTWDVHTPDGQLAGSNRITAEEQGCLLVERWRSTNGVSGQSYNFYDTTSGRWSPLATGQVRQHFEQWNDATQRWESWFTGIYSRAVPDAAEPQSGDPSD